MSFRVACFLLPALCLPAFSVEDPGWKFEKAVWDEEMPGPDGNPSLKIEPGGSAVLSLRDEDGSGVVTLAVRESGVVASPGGKHGVGPRWGVGQKDGRVLVGGVMYAPYLAPGGSTCLIETVPEDGWFTLKYLGKRTPDRWSTWSFEFDADEGMTLKIDGKPVPEKRYDWKAGEMAGFNRIVIYGDETGAAKAGPFWVGGVDYELGGAMKARPSGPKPAPSVVPERDPEPEGERISLVGPLRGKHPRLLLSDEELPSLRRFYRSDEGRVWREKIEAYRKSSKPPGHTKFLRDATDAQRQGLWRLPTVALHHLMTGDRSSFDDAVGFLRKFHELPDWETGSERNSGMAAANLMIGAALAFDWLHDELDPEFREAFRQKLFRHARWMYHGGHLKKNPGTHYWQGDPANNHRWHRNAGLTLALLAVYEGEPDQRWLMERTLEELEFVTRWLPEDGSCHEGPGYFIFGGNHLVLALDAADRCLGTDFLQASYFENAGRFRLHSRLPGMDGTFRFGDTGPGGAGGYHNFLLKAAAVHDQPEVRDGLLDLLQRDPKSFEFGWFSLLWDDPTVGRGEREELATAALFDDVGYAVMRDSWKADAVGASFKCGPFAGHHLQHFAEGGKRYVNVAHDDPDANEFLISSGGTLVVETDGYSKHKASRNHNTILINGMGQMAKGRPEGGTWSQPGGDMSRMAWVTGWKSKDDIVAVEGEAAGGYLAHRDRRTGASRPALDRYRRSFLWVEGRYVLVLDDIRAPEAVEIDWLVQSGTVENRGGGRFVLAAGGRDLAMRVLADATMKFELRDSPADHRGESMGLRQLRGVARGESLRVVSAYDAWGRELEIDFDPKEAEVATVTVRGKAFEDEWRWSCAPDRETASTLELRRGKQVLSVLGPADTRRPWER